MCKPVTKTPFWREGREVECPIVFIVIFGAKDSFEMSKRKSTALSEYELARQERIKENQKVLEELFPEGTEIIVPKARPTPLKRRRAADASSLGTGSGSASECSGDEEGEENSCPKRKKGYRVSKVCVYPRRNPSRKARPETLNESLRPVTRSLTRETTDGLVDGLEDDQDLRRTVYKTIRRRVHADEPDLPIELDDEPAYGPNKRLKIVTRSSDKVYDRVNGSTCHQCRQKTIDTKTFCHNKNCRGVRGQFCGPCLLNRYGESLVEAVRDKEWVCPPCRKICNCSFCLPKRGKPPTGIMIHLAKDSGCDNVHEYLNKMDYDY